jgi:ligand-binding sensor domain-containing protein/signal transduction histidine kinase
LTTRLRHRPRFHLALFSLALAVWISSAFAEQLPLKAYTTADGLPSDRVRCIFSDSHGFLWLGTEDGISRFDGYAFTNLTVRDGLPGASVRAVLEGRDGTYWAATNSGIFHWDPAREGAGSRHSSEVIHIAPGRPGDDVRALLLDPSGGLWAGAHDGLYRIARARDAWRVERIPLEVPESAAANLVYALLRERDGSFWIGTEGGLFRRLPGGAIDRIGGADGPPRGVRCLLEDRSGTLWVGQYRGIVEIGRDERGALSVRPAFAGETSLAGSHVTSLFEASDGKIWAGRFGGLTEIAPDRTSIRSYTTAEGLSGTGIWSLAEDRNGNLWIGSDNAGVMRLARHGFRKYDGRDGLASTRIGSLFEDREGRLCAFTRGTLPRQIAADASFLECFDGRRFHSARPRLLAGASFGWGWSQVMLQDSHREWWIPSFSGLYRFPAVAFARLDTAAPRKVYTRRDGLPGDAVFRLYEDRRGNLWVGLLKSDSPIALWDRATDSFRRFSAKDGVPAGDALAFAEDRSGAVWIGFENGLARLRDANATTFRELDGLPAGGVQALHLDREGRLWIASGAGGVGRVDRPEEERLRFARYGVEQGLGSESTFSLTEDRWGRIYIGTARGLDRLDPRGGSIQHFREDDGLARGVIETSFRDRQGDLWFGSTEGLSRLEPAADAPASAPEVRVTRIAVGGGRQALPELGSHRVHLPDIGPGATPLQIDFTGIDFAPGGRLRYQYRLDAIDQDWSPPSDQRSVVYARLAAGTYRFQVRTIANDGSIGASPAGVAFTVLPPLWKRPSVLALMAIAAAALAYSLHRYRLKAALAVEHVRMRVASDLHDDIGADLSEIAILSELAGRNGQREPARILMEIGDRARQLVDSMSDIVWSTDPRKDDLGSVVHRIRHFAANTLESRGIAWSLEVADGLEAQPLDPDRRRQMFLIVKEALANVARHAACTRASLRILRAPGEILIEIEDDGVGLDVSSDATGSGHGLANMRARAASQGGKLDVIPGPTGGTRVEARVPLKGGNPRRPAW